jgi:hypothetical protein
MSIIEMRLKSFDSAEPQLQMQDEVLINIVSYLPDHEIISNISLVSQQFCNLSRETINCLGKEHAFFSHSSGLFAKTLSLIKLDNDPTATLVMKASRICRSFINDPLFGVRLSALDFVGIDHRSGELNPRSLGLVYIIACRRGNNIALKGIQASGRFPEIPIDDHTTGLGRAFVVAAENNHPDCLQTIIDSSQFNEIPPQDLDDALRNATVAVHHHCSHLACVQKIIGSGRVHQIGLDAIDGVFRTSSPDSQQAILASGRASEIHFGHLIGWANSFAVIPEILRRCVKPMIPLLELGIITGLAILCRQYAQDS